MLGTLKIKEIMYKLVQGTALVWRPINQDKMEVEDSNIYALVTMQKWVFKVQP